MGNDGGLQLKLDLRGKAQASDIDKTCFTLNTDSHEIEVHPGITEADTTTRCNQTDDILLVVCNFSQ